VSQLHYPLAERLQDPVTERALQRVWRGIDDRTPRRPARRLRGLVIIAVLAIVAGVALGLALRTARDSIGIGEPAAAPAPRR
jgi:hypothetical protein